jgi:O-antigen/teichoic acid export membrane protein
LFVMLYAKNRPDLPAKFHLVELAIHVPMTILLIRAFGITGAAVAWAARATLDLALLFVAATRISRAGVIELGGSRAASGTAAILVLLAGLAGSKLLAPVSYAVVAAASVAVIAAFIVLSWTWVFRDAERAAITGMARSYFAPLRRMPAA